MEFVFALVAAVAVGVVAWILGSRRAVDRYRRRVDLLAEDLRSGRAAPSEEAAAREPQELRELRHTVAERWIPRPSTADEGGEAVALSRFVEFLRHSVAEPLVQALDLGEPRLREHARRVLDAVEDTEFFLEEPEGRFGPGSVTNALQEVSRELTREMNTTVKLATPDRPIRARLAPETFKDAVYLILANAAHFSGGQRVDLTLEEEEGRCRIRITDQGPGFSDEALERATEPFFTTEHGALGLGLGRAQRIVEMHAGELRIANREEGGAEVLILLPTRA